MSLSPENWTPFHAGRSIMQIIVVNMLKSVGLLQLETTVGMYPPCPPSGPLLLPGFIHYHAFNTKLHQFLTSNFLVFFARQTCAQKVNGVTKNNAWAQEIRARHLLITIIYIFTTLLISTLFHQNGTLE